jgi:hypothetical protein
MQNNDKFPKDINKWDKVIEIDNGQIIIRRQLPNIAPVSAEVEFKGKIVDINKLVDDSDLRHNLNDIIKILSNEFEDSLSIEQIGRIVLTIYKELFGNED